MRTLSQLEMCGTVVVNVNLWSAWGEMLNRVECDDDMCLDPIALDDD